MFGLHLEFELVSTFGLFVALAFLVATHFASRDIRATFTGVEPQTLEKVFLPSLVAGIAGAKIFHWADHPHEPLASLLLPGGLSFFGGLVVGAITGLWMLRRHSYPVMPILDIIAPYMLLGYAIGRLGCHIAGDGCWGQPSVMNLKPET